ncbi:abortive infection protein [Prauserella muralis]|uniref:Abortive infection protein n=1 Tax=Prauserella muralis TaxID=588067 RepID=A0A2V4ATM3_9PSEU|nr:abortive infection protein [Prauserella muralis]
MDATPNTASPGTPTASAPGRLRQILALGLVLALLVGVHLITKLGPPGIGLVAGPAVAVVLVGVARRLGLSWHDLGLSRRSWRKGALYGGIAVAVVATVYVVGALLPWTSSSFLDVRYDMALGSALLTALVIIPLNTVLLEEIAFRGVLLGMLKRPLGTVWAVGLSSTLFGLWHILPSLHLGEQNQALGNVLGSGPTAQVLIVTGVVLFTAVAGVLFSELRRRSGSVLASAGMHWATNGLGVLLSSLLWAAHAT